MRFLHFSDTHEDVAPTLDVVNLIKTGGFDIAVHTGDLVYDYFEGDISYAQMQNYCFTPGNHDTILKSATDPEGYHWEIQPTAQQLYQKFFAPFKEALGITIGVNESWWYKDVGNVRCIGFNSCARGVENTKQLEFANRILKDALDRKMNVAVFSHYADHRTWVTDCTFTNSAHFEKYGVGMSNTNLYPAIDPLYDTVDSYYRSGLNVIGWFVGHAHSDGVITEKGYPIILVGSVKIDEFNNVSRSLGAYTSRTCCNLCEFDEDMNTLKVFRLGADNVSSGGYRLMFSYDLGERRIASQCSAYR